MAEKAKTYLKSLSGSEALRFFCFGVLGVLLTTVFTRFFSLPMEFLTSCLTALGIAVLARLSLRARPKLEWITGAVFSFALAAVLVAGRRIDRQTDQFHSFTRSDPIYLLLLGFLILLCFLGVLELTKRFHISVAENMFKNKKTHGFILWAVAALGLVLCWLPYLLAFWPGMLSGDSMSSLCRALGIAPLDNQQPVMFQVFLLPFVGIGRAAGDINVGVACFSATQMLLTAAAAGYSIYWLRRKGCPRLPVLLAWLFFALFPVFGAYSITMWKDVDFGLIMLILTLCLYDAVESRGETLLHLPGLLRFLGICLLCSFSRNNGIYVVFCAMVLLCLYLKKHWKRLVPACLALLVLVLAVQGPGYKLLGVRQSPFAESLGIPLQQMARVVAQDGQITPEQKEYLNGLLPLEKMKKAYWPFTADRIKFHKDFSNKYLEDNKLGFFAAWAGMLPANFKNYVQAYLMTTWGFWCPNVKNWVSINGVVGYGGETYGVISRDIIKETTGTDARKKYFNQIERLERNGFTTLLTAVGFIIWAAFLCIALLIAKKKTRRLIALSPLLTLWLTLMVATPTYCEYRYAFAFLMALPVVLLMPFFKDEGEAGKA